MNFNALVILSRNLGVLLFCVSVLLTSAGLTSAQGQSGAEQQRGPTLQPPSGAFGDAGIGRTNLQCTGYFRMPPLKGLAQIVGAEEEQEQTVFATGDYVFIDVGSRQGVREGQEFQILRPRGEVKHLYRQKKGYLGVFVEELGQLRVVRVKETVSVAQITFSCNLILMGDLLTGVPERVSPALQRGVPFDRFGDATGKPTGRIMMSKDGREMVATGALIYIDIGDEDKVVPGDYVTIYRRVGTGHLRVPIYELAPGSDPGFASKRYRGGGLAKNVHRAKDSEYEPGMYRGSPIRTHEIKSRRPPMPRKIVGEAMVINVQVRTATAIVTTVAQEVHTGDFVELR